MSVRARLQQLGRRLSKIPDAAAAPLPVALGPGAAPLRRRGLRAGQVASASSAGGLPAQRVDQQLSPTGAGIAPGTSSGDFRGRLVLVFGTGAGSGIFVYAGVPAAGNPPVFSVVAPGVTADPFGNTVGSVLDVGIFGGPGLNVDQFGNLSMAAADGSLLELSPQANLPFNLSAVFGGTMQTDISMRTNDAAETQAGIISGVVLGSGAAAKQATLVSSPFPSTGMGMLLQAQNDGGTDLPWITLGEVVTAGAILTFVPLMALGPQVLVLYGPSGGNIVSVTRTSGSGNIPIPASVSVAKGESWGTGGSTSGQSGGTSAIGGSGSGGYSAEPALAVTPGGNAAYVIPVSGSGSDTTLAGSAVTVTAHPGQPGTISNFGAGAAASTNTVAIAGARGGPPSFANPGGGGGGGGGSGPSGPGNHGSAGSPTAGGAGGSGVGGGGQGGKGGTPTGNGVPGGSPGAGGGGGSTNADGSIGGGGQVRLTYSTGAPAVIGSFNGTSAAVTDQFGTSIPAGSQLPGPADGNLYNSGPFMITSQANVNVTSATLTALAGYSAPVAAGKYIVEGMINFSSGAAAGAEILGFTGPATSLCRISCNWQDATNFGADINAGTNTREMSSLGSNSSPALAAATAYEFLFRGVVAFSAAGTFAVAAATSTSGNFTVGANSYCTLTPVVN